MSDQKTLPREETIILAGQAYALRELPLRKLREAAGVLDRIQKSTKGEDEMAGTLDTMPVDMVALLNLGVHGDAITEEVIDGASMREIGEAMAVFLKMNSLVDNFQKKVQELNRPPFSTPRRSATD